MRERTRGGAWAGLIYRLVGSLVDWGGSPGVAHTEGFKMKLNGGETIESHRGRSHGQANTGWWLDESAIGGMGRPLATASGLEKKAYRRREKKRADDAGNRDPNMSQVWERASGILFRHHKADAHRHDLRDQLALLAPRKGFAD
jgi:hypothetical protein